MTWFFNLTSKSKLIISFSAVIFFIIVQTVVVIYNAVNITAGAETFRAILSVSAQKVDTAKIELLRTEKVFFTYMEGIEDNHEHEEEININEVNRVISDMTAHLNNLVQYVDGFNQDRIGNIQSDPAYAQTIVRLKSNVKTLKAKYTGLFEELKNSRISALQYYLNKIYPDFDRTTSDFDFLLVEQRKKSIAIAEEATAAQTLVIILGCSAAVIVMCFIIGIVMSAYIGRSIAKQKNYLDLIAAGKFNFEIDRHYDDDFGECIEKIKDARDSLNTLIGRVLHESDSLMVTVSQVNDDASQVQTNIGEVENKTITVSAAADEMVSTTEDIAKNCERALLASDECKHTSDECVDKIKNAFSLIYEQSSNVKSASNVVEQLAQRSVAISSIVNTIEEIASQTNLLALNAAIEAARAGEYGRGFAVVADEVRALASRTSSSTQEIVRMIADIQSGSKQATEAILSSVDGMESTLEEARSVEQFMDNINSQVLDVNNQITQIAAAAQEQTTAAHEISQNMQSVASLAGSCETIASNAGVVLTESAEAIEELKVTLSQFELRRS